MFGTFPLQVWIGGNGTGVAIIPRGWDVPFSPSQMVHLTIFLNAFCSVSGYGGGGMGVAIMPSYGGWGGGGMGLEQSLQDIFPSVQVKLFI